MDIEKLVDDFIIFDNRVELTHSEREEIKKEIIECSNLISSPTDTNKITEEILLKLSDKALVDLIKDAYFYRVNKFFYTRGIDVANSLELAFFKLRV